MDHRVGEIRPTQLLHTYGVGAMIDLPNIAAMVMGLDDWDTVHATVLTEERLLRAVQAQLGPQVERLLLPPVEPDTVMRNPLSTPPIGVPVAAFPQWFRCPYCELLAPIASGLFELRTDPYRPDRARFVHVNCTKPGSPPAVLPARFQIACTRGHLDDFPWIQFVHQGRTACNGPLRLMKVGASDEAVDLVVRCQTCGVNRRMSDAFGDTAENDPIFRCRGRRPHLRDFEPDGCPEPAETILLGASNSWFAITLSALSIPTQVDRLAQLVEEHWAVLQHVTVREVVTAFRAAGNLRAFGEFDDDEVWQAIEAYRHQGAMAQVSANIKSPEWEVLTTADPRLNSRDFLLRPVAAPQGCEALFEKVVLVERLREVRAITAFTRIESPGDYADPTDIPAAQRAPLARHNPTWVPASEVRGEGVFLQFSEDAVSRWCREAQVRETQFLQAHRLWRQVRHIPDLDVGFPGIRYVLIHSFAHALMRELSLEAGYTSASIRERVYAAERDRDTPPMAGVLIYTAAPDSEGTLGGLVSLGEPQKLGRIIATTLEELALCASDPLCAEHEPARDGVASLHGAACHACLFAPETACERGNKYLDRWPLTQTLGSTMRPYFPELD
jgi:hypothetical protein